MAFSDQPDYVDISALKYRLITYTLNAVIDKKFLCITEQSTVQKHCSVVYLSSYAKDVKPGVTFPLDILISITLENRTSMIVKYFLVIIDFFD